MSRFNTGFIEPDPQYSRITAADCFNVKPIIGNTNVVCRSIRALPYTVWRTGFNLLVFVSKATPIQYIIKNGSPGIKNSIKKPSSFGISILNAPYKKKAIEEIIPNRHKKVLSKGFQIAILRILYSLNDSKSISR